MATDFYRAMLCISAAYAVMRCLSVRPSVCLSVCLSRSWIMSKRINMFSFSIPNGVVSNAYLALVRAVNAAASQVLSTESLVDHGQRTASCDTHRW